MDPSDLAIWPNDHMLTDYDLSDILTESFQSQHDLPTGREFSFETRDLPQPKTMELLPSAAPCDKETWAIATLSPETTELL